MTIIRVLDRLPNIPNVNSQKIKSQNDLIIAEIKRIKQEFKIQKDKNSGETPNCKKETENRRLSE
jgi:hypothetical protein